MDIIKPRSKAVEIVEPKKKNRNWRRLIRRTCIIIVWVLFITGLVYAAISGYKNISAHLSARSSQSSQSLQPSVSTKTPDDTAALIAEVGKLVLLPKGEDPTVATVTDLDSLRGQAFFADAAVGDKVLIFSKSKKAILYRPSEKKIVAVAPLSK